MSDDDVKQFLERIVDSLPDMIFVKDAAELKFVRFNQAGEQLLGIDRESMYGKTDYDFFPKEEADFFTQKDREVLASGEVFEIPEEPIHTTHGERWLHTRKVPICDDDGTPRYLLGVSTDITEQRAAAAELMATREELQRRDQEAIDLQLREAQRMESLGVLAGGIAHDFNNLLVGILGNASLALVDLPAGAPARTALKRIETAAERAAELTHQMLAYSGRGRFVVEDLALDQVVREMADLLRVSVSKSTQLALDLDSRLPTVRADVAQIRQLIMNLITNGSEALEDKDGIVRMTVKAVETDASYLNSGEWTDTGLAPGTYVSLEVSDTGAGMTPETRARMWDPFFTTKPTGNGLGLAAVLGIVRGHGGTLKVYSESGWGTSFKVLFPASEPTLTTEDTDTDRFVGELNDGCVLIVDDEPIIREFASAALEQAGFEVVTANDGLQALELFQVDPSRFDVVVLDLTMPQMSGDETFRALRAIRPDLRVILSSGYDETEATARLAGKGLVGFIQKPYRTSELLRVVRGARRGPGKP
ncbi:MAG: response regulator [Proteobacteria bacterium]|nr:response regulator [Pseudomonadota bacterium]